MLERLESLDITQLAADILNTDPERIAKAVTDQLYKGQKKGGEAIGSYENDPYFKTRAAAKRYADWKQRITPDRDRPTDVPNLYITGKYHRGLEAIVTGKFITYINHDSNASLIEQKFGGSDSLYGLNEYGFKTVREWLMPALKAKIIAEI